MSDFIVNGTLIDGTGAEPQPLRWIEIEGGRIADVVSGVANAQRPLPAGAKVLYDATGLTVMPGIVDAHCHISYGVARGMEEQDLYASAEYRAIRAMWHAGQVLRSGVTAICDPGGSWNVAIAVRDAIKAGMFEGPRIAAAARYLTTHTGLADYYPTWIGAPKSGVGAITNDVQAMLTEVRAQAKNGVDLVKIAASGESSILSPGGGSVPAFRREELAVIVDEAHRLGKRVTAHARSGQAIVDCIDAGVDWLQHGDFMDKDQVKRLADSGIPLCPTMTLNMNMVDWGHVAGCSQARIDRVSRDMERSVETLSRYRLCRDALRRMARPRDGAVRDTPGHVAAPGNLLRHQGSGVRGRSRRHRQPGEGPLGRRAGGEGRSGRQHRAPPGQILHPRPLQGRGCARSHTPGAGHALALGEVARNLPRRASLRRRARKACGGMTNKKSWRGKCSRQRGGSRRC